MMKVGMLWFDDGQAGGLIERIEQASDYYRSKYGQKPNLCFVHPDTLEGGDAAVDSPLKVRASQLLLQDHFWIGVEEANEKGSTGHS